MRLKLLIIYSYLKEKKLLEYKFLISLSGIQLYGLAFLLLLVLILVTTTVLFIKSFLTKRKISKTTLPNLFEEEEEVTEDKEDENVTVFSLDHDDDGLISDLASYEIMQSAKKVQSSRNPFKKK